MDNPLHKAASNYDKARAKFLEATQSFPRPEVVPYTTPPDMLDALRRAAVIKALPSRMV